MKKKIIKRIIIVSVATLLILVLGFFVFKRDFDSRVEKVSKALNSYTINAKLDDAQKTIAATQEVKVKNIYADNEYIFFHLYPRAFREDASIKPYTNLSQGKCFSNGESFGNLEVLMVKVDGVPQEVVYAGDDENVLKVFCDFKGQDEIIVLLEYVITLPNCNHRFGFMNENINLGNWYPVLAHFDGEKFDLTPYYSTGDPFWLDLANFNVNLVCDKSYICASTGNIVNEKVADEKNIVIEAKAVRDFAIVLSKDFVLKQEKLKNTTINYYAYSADDDIDYIATMIVDGFEFFNSKFGEYPYRQLSVVKTPFLYGGMEYANLVMIADNIEEVEDKARVIIHEIAHQWWYGVVGNNQVAEAWVDEALTEYSAFLFFENYPQYGLKYDELIEDAINTYELYVDVIESLGGKVNYNMTDSVNEYASEYEYSYMVYVKGVIMYDSVRKEIGDKKFYKVLQKIYKDYSFSMLTGKSLINSFEKVAGKSVKERFTYYLTA